MKAPWPHEMSRPLAITVIVAIIAVAVLMSVVMLLSPAKAVQDAIELEQLNQQSLKLESVVLRTERHVTIRMSLLERKTRRLESWIVRLR